MRISAKAEQTDFRLLHSACSELLMTRLKAVGLCLGILCFLSAAARAAEITNTNTNTLGGWVTNNATSTNFTTGGTTSVDTNWSSAASATNMEAYFTNTSGSFLLTSTNVFLNYLYAATAASSSFTIGSLGNGTLSFVGANETIQVANTSSGTLTIDTAIYITNNLLSSNNANVVFNGVISGTGSMTFSGTNNAIPPPGGNGNNVLATNNTYSGTTLITGGGTTVITNTGSLTNTAITVTNMAFLTEISGGIIGGSSALTLSSYGTTTLAGTNTFSGGVTLNAGLLNINNAAALGTNTAFTIASNNNVGNVNTVFINTTLSGGVTITNAMNWNGNFTFIGSTNLTQTTGAVTLGNNETVTVASNALTVGGVISGPYSLTKSGAGTLDLNPSSSNSFSGGINVNGGTLLLDYSNISGQTNVLNTNNTLTLSGGILLLKGKTSGASGQTFGSPTLTAANSQILINPNGGTSTTLVLGSLTNNAPLGATLLVGTAAGAGAGSAVITTTDATIGGIYDPMIIFTTNGVSTNVSWATTTSGGSPYTISGSNATALLPASGASATNYLLTSGQTLTGSETINSLEMTNSSGGSILALGGNTLTITSGGILNTSGGTITNGVVTAGSTYGYNLVFQEYTGGAGFYYFGANIANNGANAVSFTKAGPGTFVMIGTNSYTGNTYVNGGNLFVTNGAVINSGTGTITVGNGQLTLGGGTITTADLIATNGNSAYSSGNSSFVFSSGTLNTSNSNAIASYIILGQNPSAFMNGSWNMNGGTNIMLPSQIQTNNGGTFTVGSSNNNVTLTVNTNATFVLGTAGIGSIAGTNQNLNLTIGPRRPPLTELPSMVA